MNENNKALNMLVDKIVSIVKDMMEQLKFDKTFKSTVWGKNPDGTYQISYMNQLYNVYNSLGTDLQIGQSVWVKIPFGIFRNMHISGVNGLFDDTTEIISSTEPTNQKNGDYWLQDY